MDLKRYLLYGIEILLDIMKIIDVILFYSQKHFVDPASAIMEGIIDFHNYIFLFLVLIVVVVLWGVFYVLTFYIGIVNWRYRIPSNAVYKVEFFWLLLLDVLLIADFVRNTKFTINSFFKYITLDEVSNVSYRKVLISYADYSYNILFEDLVLASIIRVRRGTLLPLRSKADFKIKKGTFSYSAWLVKGSFYLVLPELVKMRLKNIINSSNNKIKYRVNFYTVKLVEKLKKESYDKEANIDISSFIRPTVRREGFVNPYESFFEYTDLKIASIFSTEESIDLLDDLKKSNDLTTLEVESQAILMESFVLWIYELGSMLKYRNYIHNDNIEAIWTIIPGVILVFIAIPSFVLLFAMDEYVTGHMTVKVTGYQWFWGYDYNDVEARTLIEQEDDVYNILDYAAFELLSSYTEGQANETISFMSNMLVEDSLELGDSRLLEVDNKLVLPAGVITRFAITSKDVLHSWAMPAFGVKLDAIPGRISQITSGILFPGVFYGQCSELCGIGHGFMPISVQAVDSDDWLVWFVNKLLKVVTFDNSSLVLDNLLSDTMETFLKQEDLVESNVNENLNEINVFLEQKEEVVDNTTEVVLKKKALMVPSDEEEKEHLYKFVEDIKLLVKKAGDDSWDNYYPYLDGGVDMNYDPFIGLERYLFFQIDPEINDFYKQEFGIDLERLRVEREVPILLMKCNEEMYGYKYVILLDIEAVSRLSEEEYNIVKKSAFHKDIYVKGKPRNFS